eukprot:CAMPEP_0203009352 /NCGR_PEP_ID=MMETSP1401-20130829/9145_1 /ASSEMBLY_ACC=CAM_ASM_000894 /TAXON_ID=38833 /ORGANISM="Micromonas pusilla, Strain CCAC1681" /LENGTH=231 /DNA_ID=CAMNT_0049751017 /DNA_START=166 /DNA_END=862 /DNA_ORIENTATION=-
MTRHCVVFPPLVVNLQRRHVRFARVVEQPRGVSENRRVQREFLFRVFQDFAVDVVEVKQPTIGVSGLSTRRLIARDDLTHVLHHQLAFRDETYGPYAVSFPAVVRDDVKRIIHAPGLKRPVRAQLFRVPFYHGTNQLRELFSHAKHAMTFPHVSRFRDVRPRPVVVAEHSAPNVRERRVRVAGLAIGGDVRLPNEQLRGFVSSCLRFAGLVTVVAFLGSLGGGLGSFLGTL